MIEHGNVTRLFAATDAWGHFDDEDVWTLFHSYVADFSVWEPWGSLLHGGRLVIVPYWISRDPVAFYELLLRERVTVLNQTPSAFRQLAREMVLGGAAMARGLALRFVIFGGEALDLSQLRPFWEVCGDQRPQLVNMYGITETTVHVTVRPVSLADLERPWSSVIGNPMPDLQLYILDRHKNPQPLGVPGEIYVGGAGVARGYLNRPELSAERFQADPFSGRAGARLYKTGDLARRLPNGDVEYLGRIDHQVKIRGFRIELGEIESVLLQHPAIREAVVRRAGGRARRHSPRGVSGGARGAAARGRRSARVPAKQAARVHGAGGARGARSTAGHAQWQARPKALPFRRRIARRLRDAESTFVAPRTPVEEVLAGIWAEVLHLDRVSVFDDFFELGGHSLLATRLVSRIRSQLQVEILIRHVFDAPTVAGIAGSVEALRRADHRIEAPQIHVMAPDAMPPVSFAQGRLWFLDRMGAGTAYNMPMVLGLEAPRRRGVLERGLNAIVARHDRAAHAIRGRRRHTPSDRRRHAPDSTGARRSQRGGRRGAASPRPSARGRARGDSLRLAAWSAVSSQLGPPRGARARAGLHDPSHRLRWVVDWRAAAGNRGPLLRLPGWKGGGSLAAPGPVRRLRGLAARVAHR